MPLMFADLLRAQSGLRRHGWPLIVFLLNDFGTQVRAARGRSFLDPGSLRAEMSGPRSDPEDPPDPKHPNSFRLGPALSGGIDAKGCGERAETDQPVERLTNAARCSPVNVDFFATRSAGVPSNTTRPPS